MRQFANPEVPQYENPSKNRCQIGKNKKETITYQSQMLHYGLYTPDPQKTSWTDVPWHWHNEFEFGHIIGGRIRYKTNHHEFILREGDGIFVNSGTLHYLQSLEPIENVALRTQFFDQSFLAGYPGGIYDMKYIVPVQETKSLDAVPLYQDQKCHAILLEKLGQCEEICLKKEPFFELRIRSIFSELWETVYSWAQEQKKHENTYDPAEDERIKRMLTLIQEHYGEKITVENLACTAHISERECYRIFRNILGSTPGNFIEQIRLQKAQELLRYTNKSILEIALETGFGTSSYFCKLFKACHHITPNQYRKMNIT